MSGVKPLARPREVCRAAGGRTASGDERVISRSQKSVEQIWDDGVCAAQGQRAAGKRNQIVHAAAGIGDAGEVEIQRGVGQREPVRDGERPDGAGIDVGSGRNFVSE